MQNNYVVVNTIIGKAADLTLDLNIVSDSLCKEDNIRLLLKMLAMRAVSNNINEKLSRRKISVRKRL